LLPASERQALSNSRKGESGRLLSVRKTAERLGVCTATVYTLCATGSLPHVRVLNAIRIVEADLDALVARNRRVANVPRPRCDPHGARNSSQSSSSYGSNGKEGST
jgi:excisionase family DNA binding protein